MKLMLGDDDLDDVELFQEAVIEINPDVEVIISNTGRQLLSRLSSFTPHVIFLDINMPEMTGWECLKVLKSDAGLKHIPVIIYTTSSFKRDVDLAKELGAFRLITKPERYQDLLNILSGIMSEIKDGLPDSTKA